MTVTLEPLDLIHASAISGGCVNLSEGAQFINQYELLLLICQNWDGVLFYLVHKSVYSFFFLFLVTLEI